MTQRKVFMALSFSLLCLTTTNVFASGSESSSSGSSSSTEDNKGDERAAKREALRNKMRETKDMKENSKAECSVEDEDCMKNKASEAVMQKK